MSLGRGGKRTNHNLAVKTRLERRVLPLKFRVAGRPGDCFPDPPLTVNLPAPALAVLDGALIPLSRDGRRAGGRAPLATAIVEFHRGAFRCYVREHPFGLLPGIPNLYCLRPDLGLLWLAEWPDPTDPCSRIVGEDGELLIAQSTNGQTIYLDAATGRLLRTEAPLAATA